MLRAKAAMGFKSVKRVEVKAETTTPGEMRTTTDINGVRVSSNRTRRTLPKLEFVVEENGAILHGSHRSNCSHYPHPTSMESVLSNNTPHALSSVHGMQFRDIPNTNQQEVDANSKYFGYSAVPPMKDCILNDTRATTLAIKYDSTLNKYVCGSSIERFSGHTGICRVMGSKKYPIIPHTLAIGDLLRIGSVGLVVCELNRTTSDETMETLSEEEYQYIRNQYLTGSLQQTFRHTHHTDDGKEEEEEKGDTEEQVKTSGRTGETSDEGESEEDGGDNHVSEESNQVDNQCLNGARPLKSSMKPTKPTRINGNNEKRFCYICYDGDEEEENPLVAPCGCKGDTKYVHLECLQRWNNNMDAEESCPSQKVCAVTNTDGLDVCSICKATYLTKVRLDDGRTVSLMAKKLPPPYVTFAVVTQHEARSRSTTLTNTRFQLSFANLSRNQEFLTIGRSTNNHMTLRYRTVSQLHAKIKFENNQFQMFDASSSNGTMLYLSKPLELDWNQTLHVKIGRTVLTLKAKKRWKWTGASTTTGDSDDEISGREDEREESVSIYDPSAEICALPFVTHSSSNLTRTIVHPLEFSRHLSQIGSARGLESQPETRATTNPSEMNSFSQLTMTEE